MGLTDDPTNPNSELSREWGEYRPYERIEIEQGPWSLREISGLPSRWAPDRTGYYLVQRDHLSPHPMTWHSKRFDSPDDAKDDMAWKDFLSEVTNSWRQQLRIPGVSDYAFNHHHLSMDLGGCAGNGSVLECNNQYACIYAALRQVEEVHARRRAVGMMLEKHYD